MGQVQNGCMYKRYMSSSQKTEAEEFKDFANPFALILHSNAKSTLFVPLNIMKLHKSKHENFDFVHFIYLCLLLLDLVLFTHNTKLYTYIQYLRMHTKQLLCHWRSFVYLFWTPCELRMASYSCIAWKHCFRRFAISVGQLYGFKRNNEQYRQYASRQYSDHRSGILPSLSNASLCGKLHRTMYFRA